VGEPRDEVPRVEPREVTAHAEPRGPHEPDTSAPGAARQDRALVIRTWAPVALAAGAVVVALAGALALVGMFRAEREQLVAAVEAERVAVAQEVTRALEASVQAHLEVARARVARAREDPRVALQDVLALEAGQVVWPPASREGAATSREAPLTVSLAEWLERLEGAAPDAPADEAWSGRAQQLARVRAAVAQGDDAAVTATFRALLVERAQAVLEPRAEVATALASLEALGAKAAPAMLRALIEDGLRDPRHGQVEALSLTLSRASLSPVERAAACARAQAVAARAGVPVPLLDAACARGALVVPEPVWAVARTLTASVGLVSVDDWWLRATGDEVIGVRVDLDAELRAQAARLSAGGLAGAYVTSVVAPSAGAAPHTAALAALGVRVDAPRWRMVRAQATRWNRRKALVLGAAVLLGALLVVGYTRVAAAARRREREVVELKARFAATVSHELQTPLAAVRVMAETLELRLADEPRARDYPRRIVAEVDRLGGLVDNILAFQRIEQGRWAPRPEAVPLGELAAELEEEARRAVRDARGVEVDTTALADVSLWADPRLLRLALLNLVRNACRHNQRDPVRVVVRADAHGVEVEDNGVGVAPEDQPRLFEALVRGAHAVGQGTGLGLALVDRVARLHGGSARLVRTGPEGSVFRVEVGPRSAG
jgi:two-component system sensor histidine kinase SenX3